MGLRSLRIVLVLLAFCCSQWVHAQEGASIRKVEGKDGEFIVHTVAAKQTLYAISKMYSVSVEDIQNANSDLENLGIRIGQTLRIPVKKINAKEAKKSVVRISADTIYHEVVKKETIYGLTKKYEITETELLKYNKDLREGLKLGMVVKVPVTVNTVSQVDEMEFVAPLEDSLILHEVQPKETLYSLSKKYKVTPDSIQMVNDGLVDGLKIGATIRIPIANAKFMKENWGMESDTTDTLTSLVFRDTLKIGVFLPFCMEKNLQLQEENENTDLYFLSKISLDFMRGLDLAIDSLNKQGYHVSTHYFDTKKDTNECIRIISEENLTPFHLFIGPMFQVNFKILADQAKLLSIPIISPVKVSSRLLLDNEFVIKTLPSTPSLVINEAEYMGHHFKDSNLVLFSGGASADKRAAGIFQKYVSNSAGDSIPNHRVWQAISDNFTRHLKMGEKNTVAIVSSDEAFVSSTLSILYGLKEKETQFMVLGMDSWESFGSIDYDYLTALNVVYPVNQYVNYTSPKTVQFLLKYRSLFHSDPSVHVYSAFDIAWYFGNAFFEADGNWQEYISTHVAEGLSLNFEFVKIGSDSGYENRGGFLLQYSPKGLNLVR